MVRVARSLVGSRADPEQIGAALLLLPIFLLSLWVSWGMPWTTWGAVLSAYYFVAILLLFAADVRFGRLARASLGGRAASAALAAGMFLLLVPSALAGTLAPDVAHAGAFLFAGTLLGAVIRGVLTRPGKPRSR